MICCGTCRIVRPTNAELAQDKGWRRVLAEHRLAGEERLGPWLCPDCGFLRMTRIRLLELLRKVDAPREGDFVLPMDVELGLTKGYLWASGSISDPVRAHLEAGAAARDDAATAIQCARDALVAVVDAERLLKSRGEQV